VTVEDLVDEYVLGRCPVESLPKLATELLLAGLDTDQMAAAALPDTNDPREIRDLFEAALESVGVQLPPWGVVATRWLTSRAHAALGGDTTFVDVARDICETFDWPSDLDRLPEPFQEVLVIAGEDIEPWWRDAFRNALLDVVRVVR
jgi:hypothetical protein